MKRSLLSILACSFCNGNLTVSKELRGCDERVEYGVLTCRHCSLRYPVIEGIPIMRHESDRIATKLQTMDKAVFFGPRGADIVELLISGRLQDAFRLAIMPSTNKCRLPFLRRFLSRTPLERGIKYVEAGIGILGFPIWRKRAVGKLIELRESGSAVEALRFYYGGMYWDEMLNYSIYRSGQPRHLAALCLATLLSRTQGPLVDAACGLGHLTHFLANACGDRDVVGFDRNFVQLLIAKTHIAPSADFVCCEADRALPFPTHVFGGLICSDAFHCFKNTATALNEMQRLVPPEGLILIARFGNSLVEPREGYELTPSGYRNLFRARRSLITHEDDLLERYLQKLGPMLATEPGHDHLSAQKWLSVVMSERSDFFVDHGPLKYWPHSIGRLGINPLYVEDEKRTGEDRVFKFKFPSDWYEFENSRYQEYAPNEVRLSAEQCDQIAAGVVNDEVEQLVDDFVVIGLPERYI